MKNSSYLIAVSFLFIMMCSFSNSASAQINQNIFQEIDVKPGMEYKYHVPKSHILNFGVGFPNKLGLAISGYEKIEGFLGTNVIEGGSATPQLTLSYEYAVDGQLGIGAHVGYFSATTPTLNFDLSEITGGSGGILEEACELIPILCDATETLSEALQGSQKFQVWTFSGRVSYHQKILPKLDIYAATVLGYSLIRRKSLSADGDDSKGNLDAISDGFQSLTIPNYSYYAVAGGRYYITEHIAIYGEGGYGNITVANAGLTYRF